MTALLDILLATAEKKGCACGLRPCLIHFAEQKRQDGAGYLQKSTEKKEEEFYAPRQQDRNNSGGSSHRDVGGQPGNAGVSRNGGGDRNRPGKAVRKSSGKKQR